MLSFKVNYFEIVDLLLLTPESLVTNLMAIENIIVSENMRFLRFIFTNSNINTCFRSDENTYWDDAVFSRIYIRLKRHY